MAGTLAGGDALSRWLTEDGRATLDGLTGEALDVIGVVDRSLIVRYVNWTVPALTRESVVGHSVLDLVPPGYRDIARDTYLQVLRTGSGARFETIYAEGDDFFLWDVRVGPIRFQGQTIGLIAITNNVTEQRRDQADRDRFFSLSLDMLIVVNRNGQIKRINPAFGKALGFELTELVGRPFIDLVHPDDRPRTRDTFAGVLSGAPAFDFENRYVRSDGGELVLSWRATVDPVTKDVYAVARDISAHRAIEAQLRQAQKMEAVGQLAGGIAHDFNNLLSAILGNAELAKADEPPGSKVAELLGEIDAAARRAASLTSQLLAFSRRQPFRPLAVDLNALLNDLMKMLRRLLPEDITIDLRPGRNLAPVHADPTQLEQVVINLCVNARDAMARGGRLTIETENASVDDRFRDALPWAKAGSFVLLSVTDTGAGMTPEVRERAFEPFFTTKGSRHGTGLGLSTVYGIVQQHGGIIQVSSEPGRGTAFKVLLPADTGLAANARDEIERPAPRGQETILLAEDEEHVRKIVVHMLERAGYRAIATSNGREAIRFLQEHDDVVHLAFLDVVMPDLGGPETWEQMRSLRPGLRVLFTSGYADDRILALLPPDADVIGKPFRTEELLLRIRRKLDEDRRG